MKKNTYHILQLAQNATQGFDYYRVIDNAFDKNQYHVTTIFIHGSISQERLALYNGKVIIFKPTKKIFAQKFFYALRLLNLCRKNKFDMVITHEYKTTAIANMLQRFFKMPKFYAVIHALYQYSEPKRIKFTKKNLVKHCTFIAVSNAVKQDLLKDNPHLDPERCMVIYNTIDINSLEQEKFNRSDARTKLNINNENFIFATIGTEYKGCPKAHDILVKAFAKAKQQLQNSQLLILTHTPNAALLMSAFDVFVLPSRAEAAGKVLLEAMTHKLPIIATRAGGIPELMEPSAQLIPVDDVDALANELIRFYSMSANERAIIGNKNYQWVKNNDNFNIEKFHKKYSALGTD